MKHTILCVDDEEIILISLIEELKYHLGSEYEFETASNGNEAFSAIEKLESEGINLDLIITDWMMPEVKGDELLLKIHKKYPAIKSIMITGYADANAKERVLQEVGTLAVFTKPWDSKDLIDLIKKSCN